MGVVLHVNFSDEQLALLKTLTVEELTALAALLDRLERMQGHVRVTAADIEIPGSIDLHAIVDELRRPGPEQLQALTERHVGNPAGSHETVDQRISARAYGILLDHPSLTFERALFLARQELTGVAGLPAKVARYRSNRAIDRHRSIADRIRQLKTTVLHEEEP